MKIPVTFNRGVSAADSHVKTLFFSVIQWEIINQPKMGNYLKRKVQARKIVSKTFAEKSEATFVEKIDETKE